MLFRTGVVVSIEENGPELVRVRVALDGIEMDATGWPRMLGPLDAGDRVVVNTTGIDLGLGTGGTGFLLWNLDGAGPREEPEGHIVKMRYTPWQMPVLAAEAPESPHHDALVEVRSIDGTPVVACGLHSQIAGVAAGVKATAPDARVGYLMTDRAALPMTWSRLATQLKDAGLIDSTATAGHSFGGDLETVNVFSGMAALTRSAGADVVVVAMGPGVVGTGTALGFTAMEQGTVLDAAAALEGIGIAVLRLNWLDERPRHKGLSHHTLTALSLAARESATIAVPVLVDPRRAEVMEALAGAGLDERHEVVEADGGPGLELLAARGIRPMSMGRTMEEIPELFLASAAAGRIAAEHL
ncbi:MAG TPA: DUF3866 family protein [Actinomycetota bacterium]|nr:DUF3866 family protein [Actinomycetota bacterium]